ncbi:PIN domain-containing protein [Methanocella conradii]|uniref:PIN domain-containing protein n=1 Tax=Methanocella conradii TaxID=1175444 RepID=UPI00157CFD36|nr:PIN domain-containing protein [Methanocella conradii]
MFLDSSVWFAYFSKSTNRNIGKTNAKNKINDILDRNDRIIISTLVLLEMIDVLRTRYIENNSSNDLNSAKKDKIKNTIELKIQKVIDVITQMELNGNLKILDSVKSVHEINSEIYSLSRSHFGEIIPNPTPNSSNCVYRGMHHIDYHHALFAIECKADEIVTFDKGFSQINKINDLKKKSMIVTILQQN